MTERVDTADRAHTTDRANPADPAAGRYTVRAVERVADILDMLQRAKGGTSLVSLAAATGLPKSSAFRYLATLEARGYVDREQVLVRAANYLVAPLAGQRQKAVADFDVPAGRVLDEDGFGGVLEECV